MLTFGTAMVPVLELRGAIPVGVAAGLPPALACGAAILGNMVPVPFIMLLIRRIFDWLRQTALFGPKIEWLELPRPLEGAAGAQVPAAGADHSGGHSLAGDRRMDRRSGGGAAGHPDAPRPACHFPGSGHCRGSGHGGDDGRGTPFLRAVQRRLITCFLPRSMVRRQKRKRGFP